MHFSNQNEQVLRQIILDHYSNPVNKVKDVLELDVKKYSILNGNNVSCIDNITIAIAFGTDKKVIDAKFSGIACAICTSSTDILCDLIKGKTIAESKELLDEYSKLIQNEACDIDVLSEAVAFKNIHRQAPRIKCATLGPGTIRTILENYEKK